MLLLYSVTYNLYQLYFKFLIIIFLRLINGRNIPMIKLINKTTFKVYSTKSTVLSIVPLNCNHVIFLISKSLSYGIYDFSFITHPSLFPSFYTQGWIKQLLINKSGKVFLQLYRKIISRNVFTHWGQVWDFHYVENVSV